MLYRCFVDETGNTNAAVSPASKETERFLSLTGVIVAVPYLQKVLEPTFNALREKHFGHTAAQPVHMHRRKLISRCWPFQALKDDAKRSAWGADFISFLQQQDFTVITVTIDKLEFYRAHPNWRDHPYHLCMFNLLERYFYFLLKKNARGDVIAEGRNKRDDDLLRQAFRDFYENGARFITAERIQHCFSARTLKVLPKHEDCIGLQMADMLARPSFLACKVWYRDEWGLTPYTRQIARVLEKLKYYRSRAGRRNGFGRVWRPKTAEIKRPLSGPPKPKLVT